MKSRFISTLLAFVLLTLPASSWEFRQLSETIVKVLVPAPIGITSFCIHPTVAMLVYIDQEDWKKYSCKPDLLMTLLGRDKQ